MASRFEDASPDLDRLQAQLMVSGLQQTNNPLFQVINQLIKTAKSLQDITNTILAGTATDITALAAATFLTSSDQTLLLPNSRNLLAGAGVTFDDTTPGERTIDVAGATGLDHVVMSDGALPIPSPVDDGFGNFVYIAYTP